MGAFEDIVTRLESNGAVPERAIELLAGAWPRVVTVVRETVAIAGRRAGAPADGDETDVLRSAAVHFGESLEAIYRYGLWEALAGEAASIAAGFRSRGMRGRLADLLRAWIMAIASGVRSPDVHALIRPIEILLDRAGEIEQLAAPAEPAGRPSPSPVVDDLLSGRLDEAAAAVRVRFERENSVEAALGEVVYPALAEIGRRWRRNEISVAEEHAATAALRSAVHRFFDGLPAGRRFRTAAAIACVPGDEHEIGAEILSRYLGYRGWPVRFIGRSAPAGEIVREIGRGGYDATLLSVSMIRHLPALERLAARLRGRFPELTIIAGGGALAGGEAVMRRIADAVARTPAEAHEILAGMEERDA